MTVSDFNYKIARWADLNGKKPSEGYSMLDQNLFLDDATALVTVLDDQTLLNEISGGQNKFALTLLRVWGESYGWSREFHIAREERPERAIEQERIKRENAKREALAIEAKLMMEMERQSESETSSEAIQDGAAAVMESWGRIKQIVREGDMTREAQPSTEGTQSQKVDEEAYQKFNVGDIAQCKEHGKQGAVLFIFDDGDPTVKFDRE